MTIGIFLALIAAGLLAVWQPPVLGFLAMFMPFESPGIGAIMLVWQKHIVHVGYAGYLLAVVVVFLRLWRTRKRSRASYRVYTIGLLAAGISMWIAVSIIATGGSKIEAMNNSMEGIPALLFALAYFNSRTARCLLVAAVTVHLLIGCGIVVFPDSPLGMLRRSSMAQLILPDVWSLETTTLKDTAQFQSAVQFALYGAVGLMLGVYMLLYNRDVRVRLYGAGIAVLGTAATFFTVERGVWFGIVGGLLVLTFPLTRRPLGRTAYGLMALAVLFGVWTLFTDTQSPTLLVLREHFAAIREDTYRIPVAINSLDILLTRPVFGVGGDIPEMVALVGGAPHQSFYFYAVAYGIPAGACSLMLTWWSVAPNFRRWKASRVPGFAHEDYYLARALGLVVISMALTNGMSGRALAWICLGFACLPWAYSVPRTRPPRFAAGLRTQAAARAMRVHPFSPRAGVWRRKVGD